MCARAQIATKEQTAAAAKLVQQWFLADPREEGEPSAVWDLAKTQLRDPQLNAHRQRLESLALARAPPRRRPHQPASSECTEPCLIPSRAHPCG